MRMRCLLLVACAAAAIGCSDSPAPVPASPVAPTLTAPSSSLPGPALANWTADATVVSKLGPGGCGWGQYPGEVRTGVLWRVTIEGTSVKLEEDMGNWPTDHVPFGGTLRGQEFTAIYEQPPDGVCMFRGGTLTGRFGAEFSTFDADEVLMWGVAGSETRVQRRWRGMKR
jgi:hypothetical protein